MTKIYINNIEIPNEIIPSCNEFIKTFYEFNSLNNNNSCNESNNIELELSNKEIKYKKPKKHKNKESIASLYIKSRGYITNKIDPKTYNGMRLMELYVKYPQFFEVSNDFTVEQSKYLLDNHIEFCSDEYIKSLLDKNKDLQILYDNDNETISISHNDRNMIKLLHHYNLMQYKMDDMDNYGILPFDAKYVDFTTQYVNRDGSYVFKYKKNPYGYRRGMREVTNNNELIEAMRHTHENIYINGDINIPLYEVIANIKCENKELTIYQRDKVANCLGKTELQGLCADEVNPECFKTWAIGPKCRKLARLFKYYSFQPCIEHWVLGYVIVANSLFYESGVEDLSNWTIHYSKNADYMFNKCIHLRKLPKFVQLENCKYLCSNCSKLETVDEAFVNPHLLMNIFCAFEYCTSIRTAFNNMKLQCYFNKGLFNGCTNLVSSFNNCEIETGSDLVLTELFEHCLDLRNVFNKCIFRAPNIKFRHTFHKCPNIRNLFNGCKFIIFDNPKEGNIVFSNMIQGAYNLIDMFYNCTFKSSSKRNINLTFENTFIQCYGIKRTFVKCKFNNCIMDFRFIYNRCKRRYRKRMFVNCKSKNIMLYGGYYGYRPIKLVEIDAYKID